MRAVHFTSLLLIGLATGCGSIAARRDSAGHPYAGVRLDIYYLGHPSEADKPVCLNGFDLPFSAVADTLLLPYDLFVGE